MNRFVTVLATCALLVGCSESRQRAAASTPQPPVIRVSGAPNTIPAGTNIDVRTNESIASTSPEGQTYSGEIATDIRGQNGEMLIPRGSAVELVLLETRERSGVRGAAVQLGMRSVTVNGTTYLVVSRDHEESSGLGKNRGTAQTVGGGAALGTLIGAASGGGKGAVIGGLVGAAAGAAAQVLMQGKEVRIPAETVLQFRLDEPIKLQAATPGVQQNDSRDAQQPQRTQNRPADH